MKRPVWLFSMDSDQFNSPPTTTAALTSYFRRYGRSSDQTDIELVHFRSADEIEAWLTQWHLQTRDVAVRALTRDIQPIIGFSFYTWNAAEFLFLVAELKRDLPQLLAVTGGPHVQQAEDYLGIDPVDVVVLGEGEVTFCELLDASSRDEWPDISGIAYLERGKLTRTASRERATDLDVYPSPLDVLVLTDPQGDPLYQSISYETSRGCPFRCAFCEWGTGAIGGKMYQWSMQRIRDDWEKITAAGIKDLWLADSNFGALKQDMAKAELIVELKQRTGLPVSFATSWSKKHSRQVQSIALLLHQHDLLPHYQLALQTLTPEALRLSNRQNMESNQYERIAKHMSEQGVPIAAELIWGLPGDTLESFETNLDTLLAIFPNINIFGYTLLPGTEFYRRRDEYKIETIPVAGYGKAKGEYVVGCHTFDRQQGEEGYFLITAHILLIHGHIMPLTNRWLALQKIAPVSSLLRAILREILPLFAPAELDCSERMQVYEARDEIYLKALAEPDTLYLSITRVIENWLTQYGSGPEVLRQAAQLLQLDAALSPRTGGESKWEQLFDFDAREIFSKLAAMELPAAGDWDHHSVAIEITSPGGLGDILMVADGGSWLKGDICEEPQTGVQMLAIASG